MINTTPNTFALREIAAEVLVIEEVSEVEIGLRNARRTASSFRGRLRIDAEAAYAYVGPRFRELGFTALLQESPKGGVALVASPGIVEPQPSRLWVALLLFALTVGSTILVGGQDLVARTDVLELTFNWAYGLSYSAALLSILLAHELGHYFAARRMGVAVSYPFFIPFPFGLGTMGAFISIKELPHDRKTILAIGIAGPLAGLVVAIPVLLLGFSLSEVTNIEAFRALYPPDLQLSVEGNSFLYAGLKILMFGRFLPSGGEDVFLHPVAMAGWVGLLVTSLNLLPAGQLDGGHIFFALFGARIAQYVTMAVAVILLGLGFLWNGWFLWAILVAVFGMQHVPLLNEVTPLRDRWRWLAIFGLVVFVLVFIPIPFTLL
jgi:membrane-associated protease RseP (regulator of RpoE activity)